MKIIKPAQFKTTRWKNGKGETTELAVGRQRESSDFDWRLSKAVVDEDGEFSDFSGYQRHLMLLSGAGMQLDHDRDKTHELRKPMDFAVFSGASHTTAQLYDGAITDFNLITKEDKYTVDFRAFVLPTRAVLATATLSFIYSQHGTTQVINSKGQVSVELPEAHLLIIDEQSDEAIHAVGQQLLLISLNEHSLL